MSKITKISLAVCLVAALLGNSFARVCTAEEWERLSCSSYTIQGPTRSVYTGNENKTVIGDIFTGIGMGALMLVKVPMLVLKELGFFSYPYDYVNQVIEYEKEVRDQYSPDYQTKRYKRDHPY